MRNNEYILNWFYKTEYYLIYFFKIWHKKFNELSLIDTVFIILLKFIIVLMTEFTHFITEKID